VHFGLQYKTQNSSAQNYATAGSGEAFSGYEVALGAELAGASVDAFYTKMRDAVSAGTLSTEQLGTLAALYLSRAIRSRARSRTTPLSASWPLIHSPRCSRWYR